MARVDSRKACLNCRQRHLRCDQGVPSCGRCRQARITCEHRAVHAFRSVSFGRDKNEAEQQREDDGNESTSSRRNSESWPLRQRARFVNQTESVISAQRKRRASPDAGEHADDHRSFSTGNSPPSNLSPSATYFFNNPPSIIGLPLTANVHHLGSQSVSEAPRQRDRGAGALSEVAPSPVGTIDYAYGQSPTGGDGWIETPTPHPMPKITHPREAYLLKFFTQTWGPIFDCLDADLTFTKSVLHVAMSSFQPLFWAILATSALQLSRVSDYPSSAAKYYRSQCSKSIMPMLSTQPGASEETLFATYVMLRNYEHMTENLMEKNTETLFTAALAISANPSDMISEKMDLGRASFFIHLRQDLHVAILLRVPINTDYPPCIHREKIMEHLDLITSGKVSVRQDAVDCAWANRMAILLVDIVNFCFQDRHRSIEAWISLRGCLDHWYISKPKRFHPYYERAPSTAEGRVFPDIWLSSDCYVLAWMYYHTATVLLKTHPPNGETPNSGRRSVFSPKLEGLEREEVLIHSRAICGIAITNPNAQALIVVCHMVTISAIFFTDEAAQTETLNLIKMANSVTGHPLHDAIKKLRTAWGTSGID